MGESRETDLTSIDLLTANWFIQRFSQKLLLNRILTEVRTHGIVQFFTGPRCPHLVLCFGLFIPLLLIWLNDLTKEGLFFLITDPVVFLDRRIPPQIHQN